MLLKKREYHKNCDTNDDRLFVDFNLIKGCEGFDYAGALTGIQGYMQYNLELYKDGHRQIVADNFRKFSERNYFPSIRFSTENKGGRGISSKKFLEILDLVFDRECAERLMMGNLFAPIFIENYNMDRNSDFLITLMLPQISEYTNAIAQQEGLETQTIVDSVWDFDEDKWVDGELVLAKFSDDSKFRLILPEDILTTSLPYTGSRFIYWYWIKILNEKRFKNGLDRYTVNQLREYVKGNYDSNHEYLIHVLNEMTDEELENYLSKFDAQSKQNRDKK